MEYLMLAHAVSNAHTAIGFQLTWGSKSCSTWDPLKGGSVLRHQGSVSKNRILLGTPSPRRGTGPSDAPVLECH